MTELIGLTNQKGGVSKTTNTINVAGATASLGYTVLVVDADPQGYLTHRLGFRDEYTAPSPSLYDAFDEPAKTPTTELVHSHDEFDVLPSNIDMFSLEQSLIASGMKTRTRLQDYLQRVLGDANPQYDYVFIDAPPSLGPINDNVLIATENILVPCEPDETTLLALNHLSNQISTLEQHYDIDITTHALLLSNVEHPLDNDQREHLHGIARKYRDVQPIFEIRSRAAIKRAMNAGSSIFGYDEPCDMKPVYLLVAEAIGAKKPDRVNGTNTLMEAHR